MIAIKTLAQMIDEVDQDCKYRWLVESDEDSTLILSVTKSYKSGDLNIIKTITTPYSSGSIIQTKRILNEIMEELENDFK